MDKSIMYIDRFYRNITYLPQTFFKYKLQKSREGKNKNVDLWTLEIGSEVFPSVHGLGTVLSGCWH